MSIVSPVNAFHYDLPDERIAQRPVQPYDAAKLLVARRLNGALEESTFQKLADFLDPGDLLVLNDTRVIPARLFGHFAKTGGSLEVLLLERLQEGVWRALGRPLKRFKIGAELAFKDGLFAKVEERRGSDEVVLSFFAEEITIPIEARITSAGCMPIPPYIRRGLGDEQDQRDYQTLFAQRDGSVAAPTASLHFTERLLEQLRARGVSTTYVTLHVGAASFLPLWHASDTTLRLPGPERYYVGREVLTQITQTRSAGRRVVAVGTTVVRALESVARATQNAQDATELFITPGHQFNLVDAIVTNFHQPGTTHLLLVEAFLGRALLEKSYRYALDHRFRFLSYGDGMLLC